VIASSSPSPGGSLIDAILDFLGSQDAHASADVRRTLERELDGAAADIAQLKARMRSDHGWDYYPYDPLARRIHHLLADRFLSGDSEVHGLRHLDRAAGAPLTMVANHLSYADANTIEILLHRSGGEAIANRLTAIAGPKVFTSRERRFSSLCFGTVKVPQSADVSSGEAVLNARDVARAARHAIDVALARLRAGDALLLFGEGTRSRTASMQRMLAGAARYLELSGTLVVPAALAGTEGLFPVHDSRLRPTQVMMRLGCPLRADALFAAAHRDRQVVMDAIGLAVAALLPTPYRGVYAAADRFVEAADVLNAASVVGSSEN
jgi:1-acyl-sn-glycerol-3-phosphate acyltransferase